MRRLPRHIFALISIRLSWRRSDYFCRRLLRRKRFWQRRSNNRSRLRIQRLVKMLNHRAYRLNGDIAPLEIPPGRGHASAETPEAAGCGANAFPLNPAQR